MFHSKRALFLLLFCLSPCMFFRFLMFFFHCLLLIHLPFCCFPSRCVLVLVSSVKCSLNDLIRIIIPFSMHPKPTEGPLLVVSLITLQTYSVLIIIDEAFSQNMNSINSSPNPSYWFGDVPLNAHSIF